MLRIPCTMTKGSCGRIFVKVAGICHIVNVYAEKEVLVVCVDVIARVVNAAIFWPCVYDDSVNMCDAFLLVLLILRLCGGVCAGGYPEPVQRCRSCLLLIQDICFCISWTCISAACLRPLFQAAMQLTHDEEEDVRTAALRVVAKLAPTGDSLAVEKLLHTLLTDDSEGTSLSVSLRSLMLPSFARARIPNVLESRGAQITL